MYPADPQPIQCFRIAAERTSHRTAQVSDAGDKAIADAGLAGGDEDGVRHRSHLPVTRDPSEISQRCETGNISLEVPLLESLPATVLRNGGYPGEVHFSASVKLFGSLAASRFPLSKHHLYWQQASHRTSLHPCSRRCSHLGADAGQACGSNGRGACPP